MKKVSKREFLKYSLAGTCALCLGSMMSYPKSLSAMVKKLNNDTDKPWKWSKEVLFYTTKADGSVLCEVCPHNCIIKEGKGGFCNNKLNYNGKLFNIGYGNPCTLNVDPIEKKPLLHFLPQTKSLSLAVAGCNFRCLNCQNWSISQVSPAETRNFELWPEQVVAYALKNKCASISYTYAEPVVFWEYMYDIAVEARAKKIANVMVSNGYINEKPLRQIAKVIDAANIDLKSFDETKHFELTKGALKHVRNTIKILREENVWVEITNLVVPQWSDDMDTIKRMCDWLVEEGLGNVPLHFSRFSPMYKLTHLPMTPVSVLEQAHKTAKDAGVRFVYVGNVPGNDNENTFCPSCKRMLINRKGYTILENHVKNNACGFCKEKIEGVWS